jgi:hypothetical protein
MRLWAMHWKTKEVRPERFELPTYWFEVPPRLCY